MPAARIVQWTGVNKLGAKKLRTQGTWTSPRIPISPSFFSDYPRSQAIFKDSVLRLALSSRGLGIILFLTLFLMAWSVLAGPFLMGVIEGRVHQLNDGCRGGDPV